MAGWQDAPLLDDRKKRSSWDAAPLVEEKQQTEDPGFLGTAAISAGNWLDSKAAGLREAVGSIPGVGQHVVGALDSLGGRIPTIESRAQAAPTIADLEEKRPGAMLAGNIAPELFTKTPLGMAVLGGMDPGSISDRAKHAGIAYGGGKLGEGLGWLASKALGRSSMAAGNGADDFINAGNKWDIPLSTGQATQSRPAQIIESVVSNLPGGAGVMAKAHDKTFGAFNKAISGTFGESAQALTPDVLGAARQKIGGKIGEIASRNQLVIDRPFAEQIARMTQDASSTLTDDSLKVFDKQVRNVLEKAGDELSVTGKFYQSMDTKLGRMAKGTADGNLKDALVGFRMSMRDAFDRSVSKADAAEWKMTRKQYANLMTAADAAKNTGDGMLSPARLLQAVNTAQPNARFGSGTDLAELAQWAKKTLPDKIPNSGTAQRQFYQKMLTSPLTTLGAVGGGAYGADSLGIGPGGAAAGLLTPYVLARAMAGKPASKETEELLKRLGVGLLGTSALQLSR